MKFRSHTHDICLPCGISCCLHRCVEGRGHVHPRGIRHIGPVRLPAEHAVDDIAPGLEEGGGLAVVVGVGLEVRDEVDVVRGLEAPPGLGADGAAAVRGHDGQARGAVA